MKKVVLSQPDLIESEFFSTVLIGNKVYLKPENMQVTGAYKIRGAYYKISTLSDADRDRRDLSQRLLETMHRVLRMQQRHMV